jgi:flagellar basal-body rod protein FlgB
MTPISQAKKRMPIRRLNVLHRGISGPGYAARDMKPMDFDAMVTQANGSGTGLAITNVHHIGGNGAMNAGMESESASEEATPTGNSVSLEEEMIKLSDTQVQYQAVTNLYSKAMGMFRTALGSR